MRKFKQVHPEDFNVKTLMAFAREGRLYVDTSKKAVSKEQVVKEVRAYVARIREFVTNNYCLSLDELWEQILNNDEFLNFMTMKNGSLVGHMNRYTVTNLVYRMQNLGVYSQDVSMLTLHLKLEKTTKRNKYYNSSGNYSLPREARAFLKELLKMSKSEQI